VAALNPGPQLAQPMMQPDEAAAAPRAPTTLWQPNVNMSQADVEQAFIPATAPGADKTFVPNAVPQFAPAQNAAALQVVAQRAMQIADRATGMAQRGMLYSARTELIQALQLIAQALDVQRGTAQHAASLAAGLTALAEARDFSTSAARPGETVDVAAIAAGHRTRLLQNGTATTISPVIAQQQYFAYAQNQLTAAVANVGSGSQILYRLGRLQTAMAAHDADPLALHGPEAIVFHQAALATDDKNWLAANELGVLFARYGQLPEARRLLVYSVSVHPHIEGWRNLAVIHGRLGETELARQADHEGQLLARQSGKSTSESHEMVRWVDPQTFAASGAPDVPWPAGAPTKAVAAAPSGPRR
jgi:tetratricopeptide (TPR) repeat protein